MTKRTAAALTSCTACTELWRARVAGYQLLNLLFKIALDLTSAPASQVYTKRLFGVRGDLTAGKRRRLTECLNGSTSQHEIRRRVN